MQKPPKALVAFVALAILATALPVGTQPLLDDLRSAVGGSSPRDARGAVLKAFANQGSLPVAPGVTHDWGAAGTSGGPQAVHFVSIAARREPHLVRSGDEQRRGRRPRAHHQHGQPPER